ncbi:MAG: hypothetical protein IJ364_05620 [Oscillospiraceae bacterium]|nr:hypothetical protein [Oscillospiraceae bacterium]
MNENVTLEEVLEGLSHEQKERFYRWQRQEAEKHQREVNKQMSTATLGSLFALIPFAVYFARVLSGSNASWSSLGISFIISYACVSFIYGLLSAASNHFKFFSNKISAVFSVIICIIASIAIMF